MIEASIVIPLMILVFMSMILYSIYRYECLLDQVGLHYEITKKIADMKDKGVVIKTIKEKKKRTASLRGLVSGVLGKEVKTSRYSFDLCRMVRCKNVLFP